MTEELILVDRGNRFVGSARKLETHRSGLLHRAFSIFLVDERGRLLLQQRHSKKYHSGGLWANACCGHPRPGERTLSAARRRLREELGATASLSFAFQAHYEANFSNGLKENEIAYIYFGRTPAVLEPNPREIAAVVSLELGAVRSALRTDPDRYAYWFRYYMESHAEEISSGIARVMTGATAPANPSRSTRY